MNMINDFASTQIPLPISSISDDDHPVEVGIADSFYVDRPIPPNCKRCAGTVYLCTLLCILFHTNED